MKPKTNLSAPEFLWALIRNAYLPRELPPAITTRLFADFCKNEYSFLNAQKIALLKSNTEYETFSAPRHDHARRNLALVHPCGQLAISLAITQHREPIKKLIAKSGTSLYRTNSYKKEKAFQGLHFGKWNRQIAKIQSEYPFVLKADISRFFYTIYSHSIPWAALGKEKAKKWYFTNKSKLNAHWSNDIDKAIQACHSRETFGIPVGPDTSRVIAEIIMAGIEADLDFSMWLKRRPAVRLVDDLAIGFKREEEARKALGALRATLWKFNLQLNEEKTELVPSRRSLEDKWEIEHAALKLTSKTSRQQASQISRLLNLTLHHCEEAKTDTPALKTCKRITQLKYTEENSQLILDTLFRLAREFPRCVSHVSSFLVNNRALCLSSPNKTRIEKWVRSTLDTHAAQGHDFEVAWCLLVCGALGIKVRKSDVTGPGLLPNSIVLALLGLLRERKLLNVPLSSWPWRAEFKKSGINGHNWLPYYEAVRRKWTTDKKLIAAVKNDTILGKMLSKNVTFLEDRIFEAKKIDLTSRTFKIKGFGDIKIFPADLNYDA
jgi:hypothetical protein